MPAPALSATAEPTVLDRAAQSPTDLLYRAAVGPISADYYLPLLARFENEARPPLSWNWAACLYTLNWMAFRSLWVAALAYIGLMWLVPLMVLGIGRLVLELSDTTELLLLVAWGVLGFVVPGLVGNAVLRADLRKRMTRAITDSKTLVEACALLAAQASSRQRLIGLGVVNLVLLGGALGFYLAVPEDGLLARVRADSAPVRVAESGPVIDLTAAPVQAPAVVLAAVPASAPEPVAIPLAATASGPVAVPASAPLPIIPAPLPAALPASGPANVPAVPATAAPAKVPARSASTPPAVLTPEALPAAAAAPKTAKPYFINVGLFAQEANARKAQTTLQDAGLRPVVQEVGTGQSKRIRLRAGPFDTRAEAEAAAEKIRAFKLEAQLVQP